MDEDTAGATVSPAPDVVETGADDLKIFTVWPNRCHQRAVERDAGASGVCDAAGGQHALREDDSSAWMPFQLVGNRVGILHPKALSQNALFAVGFPVAIGVVEEEEFGALRDEGAISVRQNAGGHHHAVGKHAWRLRCACCWGVEDDDFVATGFGPCNGVFIAGVLRCGDRPHAPSVVKRDGDGFWKSGFLAGDEFDGEVRWEGEALALCVGRERLRVHGISSFEGAGFGRGRT